MARLGSILTVDTQQQGSCRFLHPSTLIMDVICFFDDPYDPSTSQELRHVQRRTARKESLHFTWVGPGLASKQHGGCRRGVSPESTPRGRTWASTHRHLRGADMRHPIERKMEVQDAARRRRNQGKLQNSILKILKPRTEPDPFLCSWQCPAGSHNWTPLQSRATSMAEYLAGRE